MKIFISRKNTLTKYYYFRYKPAINNYFKPVNKKPTLTPNLIAPCGINCGVCMAYLGDKNKCPSCRVEDKNKPKTRLCCKIKNCEELKKKKLKYCSSCAIFPCEKINHLDKRYQTKYDTSVIENQENIKKSGIRKFIKNEIKKWTCLKCGGTICMHKRFCFNCETKK